jgi:hypothetical protein
MISRLDSLTIFTTTILYQIGNRISGNKDIYVRNSIAKVQTLVKSIELTNKEGLYNEAWILFRCLLDRYIHLIYLSRNELHGEFKDWSMIQGYEYLQNAKSEEQFKDIKKDPRFKFTEDQSKNYFESKKNSNKYKKPDPKTELKNDGLNFLYKFGYDYASMRVHPMYEDGDEEYFRITDVVPNPYSNFNHVELITNTYLVASMILQVGLNQIDLKTRGVVYDYIKGLRENSNYELPFYKVIKFIEQGNSLFEK